MVNNSKNFVDSNKKKLLFCVYDILRKYSDEDHVLSQTAIGEKVENEYNIYCERKTAASNIKTLQELGFDIIKNGSKGFYLAERELNKNEVLFLVDAVFSSKIIPAKTAEQLSNKLLGVLSENQKDKCRYICKSSEISRTNLQEIFLNIELITEAIEAKKKIKFIYHRNNILMEHNNKEHIVSPYFMINNNGKYYLVCNKDNCEDIANYRLEKIKNIQILDEKLIPIKSLPDYSKGIDRAKYANENIYMFGGKAVSSKIKLDNEYMVDYVYDWFDNNKINITRKGNEIFADIVANEQALVYWALQYGDGAEIIEPETTRKKIKSILETINNKYK